MWRAVWSFVHFSFDDPRLYMVFEGWDELEMMCILIYISRWLLGLVLDLVGSELSFMSACGCRSCSGVRLPNTRVTSQNNMRIIQPPASSHLGAGLTHSLSPFP